LGLGEKREIERWSENEGKKYSMSRAQAPLGKGRLHGASPEKKMGGGESAEGGNQWNGGVVGGFWNWDLLPGRKKKGCSGRKKKGEEAEEKKGEKIVGKVMAILGGTPNIRG